MHFPKFCNKDINFSQQLFENCRIISWANLKDRYELRNDIFSPWTQLKHAILARWEKLIFDYNDINENGLYQNRHVIKKARIFPLAKLSSKEIHSILIANTVNKPTSNIYIEKLFDNATLGWSKIYLLPRLATIDTTWRSFQYQVLNDVLFRNSRLHTFAIVYCFLLFGNTLEETPIQILFRSIHVKCLGKITDDISE